MHPAYQPFPGPGHTGSFRRPDPPKGESDSRNGGLFVRSWPCLTFLFFQLPSRRSLASFPSPRLPYESSCVAWWASRSLLLLFASRSFIQPTHSFFKLPFGAAVICFGFRSLRGTLILIHLSSSGGWAVIAIQSPTRPLFSERPPEDRRLPVVRDSVGVSDLETDFPIS